MNLLDSTPEIEIEVFYRKISNNIKRKRIENGLNQLEVALEIGIGSVAFYSNCENLKYEKHFNLAHIYKLAKLFNLQPHELLI
ncbi:transcriptional regulator, XRE family [Arcobacter venerupis]|uniref:Transcriptional regulator, XRE family n=1 Tax=Arcobacter venerupis TaxID=1054033 RepID=A0AAE7B739_9BACT|nr:helix-turn-helix transcriptional regulator [Arcobacter venerupis]QKF66588.1 transcriptional regulator, XRE family [Arcobacter venerupis]RWS49675.1 transcriptional regulator [Arcobacter venerupis]